MASGGATCVCVSVFLSCHVAQEEGRLRHASSHCVRRAGKGGGGGGGERARTDRSGCLAADRSQEEPPGLSATFRRSQLKNAHERTKSCD